MNWYDTFRSRHMGRFATKSEDFKLLDFSRWIRAHKILSAFIKDIENVDINKDPDAFGKMSHMFAGLTDRLGRMPRKNEFLEAWKKTQQQKTPDVGSVGL